MAKVNILYHCGCGFQTHVQSEAEAHCDIKYHDLSVDGMIKSSTRTHPSQAAVREQQPQRKVAKEIPAPQQSVSAQITESLAELRRRLGK
jgi:hypothetical protein